jgi:hypothetical protein
MPEGKNASKSLLLAQARATRLRGARTRSWLIQKIIGDWLKAKAPK